MAEQPPRKPKSGLSTVALLALIGGLVGAAQAFYGPTWAAYHGGVPFELIGSIGGGALVGAAAGWLFQRFRPGKERP